METNWKNKYNTELSAKEKHEYMLWAEEMKNKQGRDILRDEVEYDWRGWWKENKKNPDVGHVTDKYKKPNHPTFSNESIYSGKNGYEGGQWKDIGGGKWEFTASKTNLTFRSKEELDKYFKEREPDAILKIKENKSLEDLYSDGV